MTLSRFDLTLLGVASVCGAIAAHRTRVLTSALRPAEIPTVRTMASGGSVAIRDTGGTRALDDAADLVVGADMFRLANAPSTVRYLPTTELASTGLAVPPPLNRPRLSLKAIVGGPPWQAIVDGLPGAQSPVVAAGQVVGALTIKRVDRDTVVVQGMDTTWKLTLRPGQP